MLRANKVIICEIKFQQPLRTITMTFQEEFGHWSIINVNPQLNQVNENHDNKTTFSFARKSGTPLR